MLFDTCSNCCGHCLHAKNSAVSCGVCLSGQKLCVGRADAVYSLIGTLSLAWRGF